MLTTMFLAGILITAIILLLILTYIDLRSFLLPDIYVLPFALCGIAFHYLSGFAILSPTEMFAGAFGGFLLLFAVRLGGNYYFKQEAMGLGDVKLMAAGGLWLGLEGILFAMTIGAFVSLLHGVALAFITKIKTGGPFTVARLTIPAGPGFIAGILVMGAIMYAGFLHEQYLRIAY